MRIEFLCERCGKKSAINTGQVVWLKGRKRNRFLFEREIVCSCGSRKLKPTGRGRLKIRLMFLLFLLGLSRKVVLADDKVSLDWKETELEKAGRRLRREAREKDDASSLIKYANYLIKINRQDMALATLRKSIEKNPRTVAAHISMCQIYLHRAEEKKSRRLLEKAERHYEKALKVYSGKKINYAGILRAYEIDDWIAKTRKDINRLEKSLIHQATRKKK